MTAHEASMPSLSSEAVGYSGSVGLTVRMVNLVLPSARERGISYSFFSPAGGASGVTSRVTAGFLSVRRSPASRARWRGVRVKCRAIAGTVMKCSGTRCLTPLRLAYTSMNFSDTVPPWGARETTTTTPAPTRRARKRADTGQPRNTGDGSSSAASRHGQAAQPANPRAAAAGQSARRPSGSSHRARHEPSPPPTRHPPASTRPLSRQPGHPGSGHHEASRPRGDPSTTRQGSTGTPARHPQGRPRHTRGHRPRDPRTSTPRAVHEQQRCEPSCDLLAEFAELISELRRLPLTGELRIFDGAATGTRRPEVGDVLDAGSTVRRHRADLALENDPAEVAATTHLIGDRRTDLPEVTRLRRRRPHVVTDVQQALRHDRANLPRLRVQVRLDRRSERAHLGEIEL